MDRKIKILNLKFNEELIAMRKPEKIVIHNTHNHKLNV